ncbi:uncharacterized protein LOC125508042 [Triticum urartu]|nr:uncharacterized protein LOC125508042 [Triticum urartu]XP_048528557.1 uncharacterized protein LOC125508042 [Triticum urartu]XP_048528558.1 uncharacterized protein LOC125508042 [Triticum urartu]
MDKQKNHKNAEMGNDVFRRIILNQVGRDIGLEEENVPCNTPRNSVHSPFGGSSAKFGASTSGSAGAESVSPGEYVRDPGSILSLQPWIFKRSSTKNNEEMVVPSGSRAVGRGKNLVDGFRDGSTTEVSTRSPGLGSGPGRGRGALRSRRAQRHFINPLVATENSYIPQLYNENFEFEECTFAPVPSPASARPFIVTDGRRIISKSRYEPVPVPFDIGFDKEESRNGSKVPESVVGIAPLPELNKSKRGSQTERYSKPSKPPGLLERMLMFSSGVGIGIISSSLSSKKDLDSLNGTLKRMENLVQDLQDELEMKEGLTVKELPNETSGELDDGNIKAQTPDSISMSKIEAELEAELARLELNITSNHLEEEPFDLIEIDQEFIGDIVQGELKSDMIRRDIADYSSDSDHGRDSRQSSPDYTHETNYPVSPRDLSLRLHKVIQHRLEDRIKELETALAQSQKQAQLHIRAGQRVFSEQTCSNSDSGSSSNQDSPLFIQETSSSAEPFCLNLAGDALEAYDEAYEEFMRIADSPCTTSTNGRPQVNEDYSVDRSLIWGLEDESATELKEDSTWEQAVKSGDPNRAQESDGDESGDEDDHNSEMLIQQIVERTKQGSPVLIHAHRMLFSVDD